MTDDAPPPRNVLLITVDQWRGDCLSGAGHPVVQTPTLDALASEGVRFDAHYAQCAPCGPSRTSLHTGMYLQNHRSVLNGTPLDDRHTNLALEARALGYDPWLFGYTDTSIDPRTVPADDPRLRTYEGVLSGFSSTSPVTEHDPAWVRFLASRGHDIPESFWDLYAQVEDHPGAVGRGSSFAPTRIPAEHSETAFLTDSVIDHLRARAATAPSGSPGWFVHASYLRPHPPFVAPEGYHDLFDPADVPAPVRHTTAEREGAVHRFLEIVLALSIVRSTDDEVEQRQTAATYYGLMRLVDDEIGRLLGYLRESGQWDDTLVIVTADHGEQMGDHWMMGKLGWFDESYRIPLIVRDPRADAAATRSTVVDAFTENIDLMPTILDWLGVDEIPLQCDGRSLLPFLSSGTAPPEWRTEAHWEFDFRNPWDIERMQQRGFRMEHCVLNVARSRTHKLVVFPNLPPLLYDLDDDPHEMVDRSADPAKAATLLEATQRMLAWRMVNDERILTGTMLGPWGAKVANDRLR
jgi:arylsulfatase A-like enzyme